MLPTARSRRLTVSAFLLPIFAAAPAFADTQETKLHALLRSETERSPAPRPVLVLFQKGIPRELTIAAVERSGGEVTGFLRSLPAALVTLPGARIPDLAREDLVQWIEPPPPAFVNANDKARMTSQIEAAQAAPYGLDGTGIKFMQYEFGGPLSSHPDLVGRTTVNDVGPTLIHATHVAGILVADGTASSGFYRGMAPGATLDSFSFQNTGVGTLHGSNPIDLETDYARAVVELDLDVSNNSIVTPVSILGYPCETLGNYDITQALLDAIVTGSLGRRFPSYWAGGNERGEAGMCSLSYYSLPPSSCAKNTVSVGAVDSVDETVTVFSSFGPTDDGRIKPDLVAPGCEVGGDLGTTSTVPGAGLYGSACGTSMASPVVAGGTGLMLQDFRAMHPNRKDPRPASYKTLFVHTAADVGQPGPDYIYGWGSVRVVDAIELMRSGRWFENEIDHAEQVRFEIDVPAAATELRVTLAWDDPPAVPGATVTLVNDLDFIVFDPSLNRAHPWTLDPLQPAAPAVRLGPDHRNNVEQVLVANPVAGVWTVLVNGTSVPEGPQDFTVTASPGMQAIDVTLVDGPPEILVPGVPYDIPVRVEAIGQNLVNALVFHRPNAASAWTSEPLGPVAGDEYMATLPAFSCNDAPQYYIVADGAISGTTFFPASGSLNPLRPRVGFVQATFQDDFETDLGWTTSAPGDDATAGLWTRVDPVGSSAAPEDDHTLGAGGSCFVTGQGAPNDPADAHDLDGGTATLESPDIELDFDDATISYWRWFSNAAGANPHEDVFEIELSGDGGNSWIPVETLGPTGVGVSGQWFQHSFLVSEIIMPAQTVRVRFIARDLSNDSLVEAAVDDVRVTRVTCHSATNYCATTPNSVDPTGARMGHVGSLRISLNDFELTAAPVPSSAGLFYFGNETTMFSQGLGIRCVAGPVVRRLNPASLATFPTAQRALDFATTPGDLILPGSTWYFQYWYRDNQSFNFSDGLQVIFAP